METKHLKGLAQDLDKQLALNKKDGVSDTLKSIKKRPEGNYHGNARYQYYNSEEYKEGWEYAFGKNKKKKK